MSSPGSGTWYPLQFEPIFRPYLWGGRRLQDHLGKSIPQEGIWAESWEIVDRSDSQSIVADGPWKGKSLGELRIQSPEEILGASNRTAERLPLLLKYLDCQQVLSVQVHPDDHYGLRMTKPDLGKTEAWYVVHADPGAVVYTGLKPGVSANELRDALESGAAEESMHRVEVEAGDCIFIPAGTVHALGAGLIVAEIQQSSDTTFRLFDWNRVDSNGVGRPLHIQQALEVIDFDRGPVNPVRSSTVTANNTQSIAKQSLVQCDKFHLDRYRGIGKCRIDRDGYFTIVTVPRGSAKLRWSDGERELKLAMSVLIPSALSQVELVIDNPDTDVLVATTP